MKNTENTPNGTDDISRKEAVKKMGKVCCTNSAGNIYDSQP